MIYGPVRTTRITLRVGRHPQDLAWAPDGKHLYVTNVACALACPAQCWEGW